MCLHSELVCTCVAIWIKHIEPTLQVRLFPEIAVHWPVALSTCSHTQTHQRLDTYTRKRRIEKAASCVLFEPCWRFSWQSAKVGAAQTAAVQGKFQSANVNGPGVFVFNEAPRYDSRGFAVSRRAYLCQQSSLARALASVHTFGRVNAGVHARSIWEYNVWYERGMNSW